jgi:DNA-binding NarL/FixJ family response regulator
VHSYRPALSRRWVYAFPTADTRPERLPLPHTLESRCSRVASSNAELAGQLHLSEATVKTHVARILGKLNLRDRVQAVVVASETGLVTPGEA